MTTATVTNPPHISNDGSGESFLARIQSIDIFRGITLAVMIFVNDLDETRNLPWWTFHAPRDVDVMTYVDMVFPIFLFLVGMSLPIAINARLRKNPSLPALWGHVFLRSFSLVVLGLIQTNAAKADPSRMIISPILWELLGFLGCSFFLSVYPGKGESPVWHKVLHIVGVVMVIAMYAIFRRTGQDGQVHWIAFGYPDILGVIGYAYFAACLLYIPFRRWLVAPFFWFAALVTLNAVTTDRFIAIIANHSTTAAHWFSVLFLFPPDEWPWDNGASASLVMAGVVTTVIFMQAKRFQTFRQKLVPAMAFAVAVLVAGYLLAPLGISKVRATPTWCLYTVDFGVIAFALLYWLCDIQKKTSWAFAFRPAGSNSLLTFLLPTYWGMILSLLGIRLFFDHVRYGWHGVVKSILFTCLMLAIVAMLTRRRVRLAA